MAKSVSDVVAKWQRNLSAASQTIRDGVNAVTTSPTELAAQQKTRYVEGVQRAAESGKWEQGLRSVSLQDWKDKMLNVGIDRINKGVQQAVPKVTRFMQQFLPYVAQVSKDIQAMPKGTDADSEARMLAAFRKMKAFQFNKGK